MSPELEAIINRTKGRAAWFVDGFKAEDAVRQFAPEFELLVAEIERLRGMVLAVEEEGISGNGMEDWNACPWCKFAEWHDKAHHAPDCAAFSGKGNLR